MILAANYWVNSAGQADGFLADEHRVYQRRISPADDERRLALNPHATLWGRNSTANPIDTPSFWPPSF
jgi:hypothetical protein